MSVQVAQPAKGWEAQLQLQFQAREGGTTLLSRHHGPLRIQKALYPEGRQCAQAIIIHPPGGIAGGDVLEIEAQVERQARALITTPGAAKWYGASGEPARQNVRLNVSGQLEWLPQETIVFNHAQAHASLHIQADADAAMIGWETLIFGRRGSGERFTHGRFCQHIALAIDHTPVWEERLVLEGDDPLFASPIGLRGEHSLATTWALRGKAAPWQDEEITALREGAPEIAWTRLYPTLLVGRALGDPLALQQSLRQAWLALRPLTLNAIAQPPRIWAT